jgi:methylmalonyl-CoA/ethylmalonyl-CoA epimerase
MNDSTRWMFHASAMVRDFDGVVATMVRLFGCRVLHVTTDTDRIGRRGGMTWIGDNSLEIGEPAGAESPVQLFIERFGPGVHSVAVQVHDIDDTVERLKRLGVGVASRPYPGLMFTRPSDTNGLLIEWYSNERDDDPRFGATLPPLVGNPTVAVSRFAYVGAAVADPHDSAVRLAAILGTSVLAQGEPTGPTEPHAAVSLGDCVLALFDLAVVREHSGLFGRPVERPQIHTIALEVDDIDSAEASLRSAGVPILRRDPNVIVPDPATIGMSVLVTSGLLPRDPRLSGDPHG